MFFDFVILCHSIFPSRFHRCPKVFTRLKASVPILFFKAPVPRAGTGRLGPEKDSTWPSGSEWLLVHHAYWFHFDRIIFCNAFRTLNHLCFSSLSYTVISYTVSALWFCLAFLRSGGENGPDACWKTQVFSAFLCQPPKAAASVTQCSVGYLLSVLIGWLCDFL